MNNKDTAIMNYIAELDRAGMCTADEAAQEALTAAAEGLEALPEQRRGRFVNYCLHAAAMKINALSGAGFGAGMEPCDWVNEFYLNLERILRRYDPERAKLSTFLSNAVVSFMQSYAAENDIRGRHYLSGIKKLRSARRELIAETGAEPADEQLMERLGWGRLRLNNARIAENGGAVLYLSNPVDEDGELTLGDTIESGEPDVAETAEKRIMLGRMQECLAALPDDRSRYAVIHNIVHGESYGKIGEELGTSREGVRKMVNRTLERLREMMCA